MLSQIPQQFEAQFFSAAGARITYPKAHWIGSVNFELIDRGGFGQCSVEALMTWEEMVLTGGERLDIYLFGTLVYRGFLQVPHISLASQQNANLQFYGLMGTTNNYKSDVRLAYGDPVDLAVIFTDLANRIVRVTGRLNTVELDAQTIGVTADRFDASGKNFTQAANALCDLAPLQCIWGFDVTDGLVSRLYFRPRVTDVAYRYSIGGNAVELDYPRDLTTIVNRVKPLTGGKVAKPNLLTDGSFENPLPNSETNGNLLGDYSFEGNTGGATLAGGATRKTTGDNGGPRTGSFWVELDSNGEHAAWTVPVDYVVKHAGSFWARRETAGTARQVRMKVEGLTSGASTVVTLYVPTGGYVDPGSDTYVRYREDLDFTAYPTVTQARVTIETNGGTGSDDGVDIDDAALYPKLASPGAWTHKAHGNAYLQALDWLVTDLPITDTKPYHGAYAVKIQAGGIGGGSDYIELVTAQSARVPVRPNNPYAFGIAYRMETIGDFPDFKLVLRAFKSDDTQTGSDVLTSAVTVSTVTWTIVGGWIHTPADAAKLEVGVRLLDGTAVYFDAAMLVYGELPSEYTDTAGGYWQGETYERIADVLNADLTALLSSAAQSSITDYGEHEAPVSNASVVDWTSAKAFLGDYFNAHATPSINGSLKVIPLAASELLVFAGAVQVMNLSPSIAPLSPPRIRYSVGDSEGITISADIGNERPDMADLLRLTEARAKAGTVVLPV